MLFHEIYGSYYNVIAAVLGEAVKGKLTKKKLQEIIYEKAFDESILNIPDKLVGGQWNLLTKDYGTPLSETPRMSLTTIQKQWLKALLSDPRIQLFAPKINGLEEVEPLFTPEMLVYYDRNADGDPFSDKTYIDHFRTIFEAMENEIPVYVNYDSMKGHQSAFLCCPEYLEYSPKDDKFRVTVRENRSFSEERPRERILNMARITECTPAEKETDPLQQKNDRIWMNSGQKYGTVTLQVFDDRNTLERVLLHFSHLKKETKKMDGQHYIVNLTYEVSDETEMLIRILAFGPTVKVLAPETFIVKVKERLRKQKELENAAFLPGFM